MSGNAPSLTVDALRGDMATHRRGLRPAQWPVRDLLGEQRSRMGGLRDPRLYAAVGGLLACGAAATVAFTASDGAQGREAGPGPMALPIPNTVVPAPVDPGPSDPDSSDPGSGSGSGSGSDSSGSGSSGGAPPGPASSGSGGGSVGGSGPVPRAWRLPQQDPPAPAEAPTPADGAARSASVREIADRLAAELERLRTTPAVDGTVDALLVVPQQRGGDLTALVKRVRADPSGAASPKRAGGRHRAPEAADTGHRARPGDKRDRDEHARDEDRKSDRAEHDGKHDQDGHARAEDRKHDRDGHRKCDRDERDRDHRQHGDRDRDHDGDRHHAKAGNAGDCDEGCDGDQHVHARPARAAAGRPAMAAIGASSHGDRGERLGGRTIESDALLAALADLGHPTPFPGWFDA